MLDDMLLTSAVDNTLLQTNSVLNHPSRVDTLKSRVSNAMGPGAVRQSGTGRRIDSMASGQHKKQEGGGSGENHRYQPTFGIPSYFQTPVY